MLSDDQRDRLRFLDAHLRTTREEVDNLIGPVTDQVLASGDVERMGALIDDLRIAPDAASFSIFRLQYAIREEES